jgi:hypothetical protein
MLAKAVRIASASRAAMALADLGQVAEAATLLRVIDDFAKEIIFVAEGELSGNPTAAQRQFVHQFFLPPPSSAKELAKQERRRFISRDEIYKAFRRIAQGEDGEELCREGKFLDAHKNAYIHGGYREAMDLYEPLAKRFAISRTPSARHTQATKQAVALQIYFGMVGYWFLAMALGLRDVADSIRAAQDELECTLEYSGQTA